MRLPNGFGNVSKLPGNRRKPYRARITVGWEVGDNGNAKQQFKTIGYYKTKEEGINALQRYKRYKNEKSFVYFITDGEFIKIGKSNDPNKRLKRLQVGQPTELKIIKVIETKSEDAAYELESKLHKVFSSRRVIERTGKGRPCEWFDITQNDINSVVCEYEERRCVS